MFETLAWQLANPVVSLLGKVFCCAVTPSRRAPGGLEATCCTNTGLTRQLKLLLADAADASDVCSQDVALCHRMEPRYESIQSLCRVKEI